MTEENKDQTPVEKPKRRHSEATKRLMSERRRSRTKQPRDGQSKKRQNFMAELMAQYKNYKGKHKDELKDWFENNRHYLSENIEQTKEIGIMTEYTEMYAGIYERQVGSITYGKSRKSDEAYGNEMESFLGETEEEIDDPDLVVELDLNLDEEY